MIADDVAIPRTRADLERELVTADPELADAIRAALETDESSPEWTAAELALSSCRRPLA